MAFRVDGDGFYITKKRVIYNDDPPTVCDGFANSKLYRKHNGRHWVYYRTA